jgi:prohibitin 1
MAGASADALLTSISRVGFAAAGLSLIPMNCLYNVDGGERAVMFNVLSGISNTTRGEGTHFKMPYLMRPFIYDIKTRPKLIQTTTPTKDLQNVTIHCRLLFKPEIENLPIIHQRLGPDYDEKVLISIGNEVLKMIIAQYNAEQLLTQRERVSREIREQIVERSKNFHILMDDVSLTHLVYGKEFAKAIEEKQVAEQEAERAKFVVQKAEQERQATVIRSEGEAQAAELISVALQQHGTGLIEVRRIDAAKEIAETLGKSGNVMYLPGSQQMLLNMGAGGARAAAGQS